MKPHRMIDRANSMAPPLARVTAVAERRHSWIWAVSFWGLARTQREGAAQRSHLCVGGDVEKTAGQPQILEERPKVLIPHLAVEGKIPEVVKQHRCRDHVKYEQ